MNRADKRRRRKQAGKAARRLGGDATGEIAQALDQARRLHMSGRLAEADALYGQILHVDPDQPAALHLKGVLAYQTGRLTAAVDLIGRAVAARPDHAEALSDLGLVLNAMGRAGEAVEACRRALDLRPDFAAAHNNLGTALRALGRTEDAVASFKASLAREPDAAAVHANLANAYRILGRHAAAFASGRRAVELAPDNPGFWSDLAAYVPPMTFAEADDDVRRLLQTVLERPGTVSPAALVRPVLGAVRAHPGFAALLAGDAGFEDAAATLAGVPLFLALIALCPIDDLEIERLLTRVRAGMPAAAAAANGEDAPLPAAVALAIHCFTNEYVYPETPAETAAVAELEAQVAAGLNGDGAPAPLAVAALGAYRPLYGYTWAETLAARLADDAGLAPLIARQVTEPLDERARRAAISALTPIADAVSKAVRDQYEAHPYPRWVKPAFVPERRPIDAVLAGPPLHLELGDYRAPAAPDVLVAGCGTGQHALGVAATFAGARVLAVDLSLSSLAYAQRKAEELGVGGIEFAQADIMELGGIGRQFDLIESVGVLHHMADPLAGWRVLTDLLRADGVMKIALYSDTARRSVVEARARIAEKGYAASAADMRRCRQDLIELAGEGDPLISKIVNYRDFYSLSECRDLLFHVQEHRFTLHGIETALDALGLKFLGFELRDQGVARAYRAAHPDDPAMTALDRWHAFEQANPDIFIGMYNFWCRKA